ncbi:MAG: response regulator [Gammaproteobacteria bacterium]|nr:response regulator [Gammaproteobacteria bacterium]
MSPSRATILVVDDAPDNIDVLRGILAERYNVHAATSGQTALRLAERQTPDLILLDVMMPTMDGYEVCRHLKAAAETAHIPVIFVTARCETADEQRGFDVGAVDYITKPVNPTLVGARVRTHLALADQQRAFREQIQERTQDLEAAQREAIFMLGEAGHYNDTDTGVHIWRMAAYAAALAGAALWPIEQADLLELAAPMHDTGKIGIPDRILKAPRRLTADEWQIMQTHTEIGHRILSKSRSPLFQLAADIALCHHERWDGSGYPRGLAGEQIPQAARIVAIADVFDALTMQRPYKQAWSVEKALATMQAESERHFDPQLLRCFFDIKAEILTIRERWNVEESRPGDPTLTDRRRSNSR